MNSDFCNTHLEITGLGRQGNAFSQESQERHQESTVGFAWDPLDGCRADALTRKTTAWRSMGIAWEVALAAVLVEGVIFMIISLPQVGWRTKMINAIPKDLKIATGAGIGMFLAIIGLREMGWIQDDGATLVNLATTESFSYDHGALISLVALIAIAVMMARGIKGAIIYGILGASVYGWAVGAYDPYNDFAAGGAGWGS